jgi:hypothetical protein
MKPYGLEMIQTKSVKSRRTKQTGLTRLPRSAFPEPLPKPNHNGSCNGTNACCSAWWTTRRSTPCPWSRCPSSRQVRPVRNLLGRTLGSQSRILVEKSSISHLWRFSRCDCRSRTRNRGLNARLADAETRSGGCTYGSNGSYAWRVRR